VSSRPCHSWIPHSAHRFWRRSAARSLRRRFQRLTATPLRRYDCSGRSRRPGNSRPAAHRCPTTCDVSRPSGAICPLTKVCAPPLGRYPRRLMTPAMLCSAATASARSLPVQLHLRPRGVPSWVVPDDHGRAWAQARPLMWDRSSPNRSMAARTLGLLVLRYPSRLSTPAIVSSVRTASASSSSVQGPGDVATAVILSNICSINNDQSSAPAQRGIPNGGR